MKQSTAEHKRLLEHRERKANWRNWGPYLSERAWGTVREDYSSDGAAWGYFPHDHARSRAYRWNEDGLAGISNRNQTLCFALALWNGRDPILKERLFGLTGPEGNHGEDVKEYYFYLDNTPTHSYMKMLYKYPQVAFPYADLIAENQRRGRDVDEYELLDTAVFDQNRYFDVFVEYGKADEEDILIQISVVNRGDKTASCAVLPTLWFRNSWSWGYDEGPLGFTPEKPQLEQIEQGGGKTAVRATHATSGNHFLYAQDHEQFLFTENETNNERLFNAENESPYVKDAFHRFVVDGEETAVNPKHVGTKTAAVYHLVLAAGETQAIKLRLTNSEMSRPFAQFDNLLQRCQQEADEFYAAVQHPDLSDDARNIQRQALAGMLWTKQLYYYDIKQWLDGDPATPSPPKGRRNGRNAQWQHLTNFDVISMPDKWEYPWYAAWDLAFHCIPLVMIDPDYAKRQLILMTREWYMHPNGQLPAYEWAFGDVNPPVHAWAAWRVYKIDEKNSGKADRSFLEAVFHKMLLNFTWWVNRKDEDGNNVFQGGFLGLDNISLFDRSASLPADGHIDQSDGTSWMAFYSLGMMRMALELAKENPTYQDLATKFFEHFLSIAAAMSGFTRRGVGLWDEEDGFFYDVLHFESGEIRPLKVRSLVGLMPLIAVEILEPSMLEQMDVFNRRVHWFMQNRPYLSGNIASVDKPGVGKRLLFSILTRERLISICRYMLDETEFLSPHGVRSLSKTHEEPYTMEINGRSFSICYTPAESRSGLFGGNSNWRGPVWFPINFLLIEALQRFHHYYGDECLVELPTGSDNWVTLKEVATELAQRLSRLFLTDKRGKRPVYGNEEKFQRDPQWRDLILFYEYFHGDNGTGLGASHQTGWTGLVAKLLQDLA